MCKIIAIANQKGGVAKTTTTINLGVGLSKVGKRVMLIDADPQGHLTMGLGFPKNLRVTLKTMMENIIMGLEFDPREAILHHEEGIEVTLANSFTSALICAKLIADCCLPSVSMSITFLPSCASAVARFVAIVLFPVPPFVLITEIVCMITSSLVILYHNNGHNESYFPYFSYVSNNYYVDNFNNFHN